MEISKKYTGKIYNANECCVFRKTKELFGGLSNMASGYPIQVNGIEILSSEALYQSCRFPHLPEVQKKIISQISPMSAKMVSKPFRINSRSDWDEIRIKVMRWCLRVKLAQNFVEFGTLLETTFDKPIVEDSSKDDFWGTIRDKNDPNIMLGVNALGRLLMELRQFYSEKKFSYEMFVVEPPSITDFKIFGQTIERVDSRAKFVSHIRKSIRFDEIESLKPFPQTKELYQQKEIPQIIISEPTIPMRDNSIIIANASVNNQTKKKKRKGKNGEQGELIV